MTGLDNNDVTKWSISELSKSISNKVISPVEVTEKIIEKIYTVNKDLNCFITVMDDYAIKKSKEAEKEIMSGKIKGPLHGIPIGLKDIIATKGTRTTYGSERYKDFMPDFNATIVDRLEDTGSIIIGKQNLHQFAYGTTGDRSYFGPTRNPLNLNKITGGSSAGSAAAVAANLCYGAIGSDTGGSIRIPASCCGIVGMKPTFGLVSKYGAMSLSWTLDHLGPLTRTVKDNALILNAITGYDSKDAFSVHSNKEDYTSEIGKDIKGMKIGVPRNFYLDIIQPEVKDIFENTIENLKQQGAIVVDVEIEHMDELLAAQQVIIGTESYVALSKEIQEAPELVDDEVRARITSGVLTLASDYIKMLRMKNIGITMFNNVLKEIDVLITPTLNALPVDIEQREIDFNGRKEHPRILARLTGPTNTTGFPSISVPGGFSSEGLSVGIQFIGAPFSEKALYKVAYALENNL